MPQKFTRECLSANDRQVLDSVFNPLELSSFADVTTISAEADLIDHELEDDKTINLEDLKRAKLLEVEAIKLTEEGKLNEALQSFQEAINVAPERASIYNNRAQALRLMKSDDEALSDLSKSIDLCTEKLLKTKCHALCQRGVLFRKRENLEAARSDFNEAAKLGSQFARTQLVEINPFAALCNQMLRQAFEELK
ncbi:tetratricopeptide repeat protein 36 homolog [Teleopsis dalmanni]|uniref:tetratricopeptide repeat protein 36 homolog n=1 Tax=Teleopsis dalmanni TaxID=139649 RepID=UPI0018CCB3EA|nr:tetratricopeptide repeat protein 36 homolog [Teleopsis dalmanni]